MCTLTLAWQVFADAPVVVAANRDEALDRPSEPPTRRDFDGTTVVAPGDAEAGGTWVGYNEHGLFAGITNRWVEGPAAERSRGLLVRDVLRQRSVDDAAGVVERAVRDHEYDGFNLVVADGAATAAEDGAATAAEDGAATAAEDGAATAANLERAGGRADSGSALLFEWDGFLHVREFDPGVHVVVNVGADDSFFVPDRRPEVGRQQASNARAVRDALRPDPDETADAWLDRAGGVLGDHEYGVCVHGDGSESRSDGSADSPAGGYGTRSSSLIRLGSDGSARYEFAPGPPCTTAYERVDATI